MKNRLYQIRVTDDLLKALGEAADAIDQSPTGRGGGRKEITRADLVKAALADAWGIGAEEFEAAAGLSPAAFIRQGYRAIRAARFARVNREFCKPALRVIEGGAAA